MVKGRPRENKGPCVICGKDDINEKYRKITPNLFQKALKSLESQNLAVELKLYDQLCEKHYNDLVVFDRNISKKKLIREVDLAYNDRGNRAKRVCLLQETYEDLLNNASSTEQLEREVLELRAKVDNHMRNSEKNNDFRRFSEYFNDQVARMTRVLYQDQRRGNLPKLDATDFVEFLESQDSRLEGFFDILFKAMNPKEKNKKTQESLKQKIMVLCYQMAGLRNKQVSGVKSAIGLFLVESGTSTHCVNTIAKMGFGSTYQTAFNRLDKIESSHQSGVQTYIQNFSNNLLIACVDDYHNIHGTRIPSTNSTSQIAHMATVLLNTAQISPVPYYSNNNFPIHNCHGVDASLLKMICKEQFMITLAISYNSIKSSWSLATDLIDNDTDLIENLTIHSYDTDISEKYHRKFNQIKLVDCVELDLKNNSFF